MTRHDPAELRALQAAAIARGEPFSVPLDDLLIAAEEREMAHPDAGKRCSRCGRPAYNCADPCVCNPANPPTEPVAAQTAPADPLTAADLAEIEARTSGPGPLAEDGALMRRCAAEIRALRKGRREAAQTLIAEIGAAGPEDIEQAAERAIAQIREQDAEIDRWKTAVVSKAAERDVAVTENGRLKAEVERLTAELARWTAPIDVDTEVESEAREVESRYVAICERLGNMSSSRWPYVVLPHVEREARLRSEIERLTAELAGQTKAAIDWREAAKRHMARAEALRPGLTEEQALDLAKGLEPYRREDGISWRDRVAAALLRASRGALAPAPHANRAGLSGNKTLDPVTREVFIGCLKCAHRESSHARLAGLTEEQLDVLARAMPDVVDYERATPEQRRSTVLDVLAAHGPRPLAPGHVSIPRHALEKLVDATQRDHAVREARETAERALHLDALRCEPARHDADAARALSKEST